MSLADLNSYSGSNVTFTANKRVESINRNPVQLPVPTWDTVRDLGNLSTGNITVTYNIGGYEIVNLPDKTFISVGDANLNSTYTKISSVSMNFVDGMYYDQAQYDSTFNLSDDWTVELWFRCTQNDGQIRGMISNNFEHPNTSSYTGWAIFSNFPDYTGQLGMQFFTEPGGIGNKVSWNFGTTTPTNVWSHLAVVRSGNTAVAYLNGASISTQSITSNIAGDSNNEGLILGALHPDPIIGDPTGVIHPYKGQIDQVRISNVARYTGNFTPSTDSFDLDNSTTLLLEVNTLPQLYGSIDAITSNDRFDTIYGNTFSIANNSATSTAIEFTNAGNTITVGNITTVEDYLAGTVEWDIKSSNDIRNTVNVTSTVQHSNSNDFVTNGEIVFTSSNNFHPQTLPALVFENDVPISVDTVPLIQPSGIDPITPQYRRYRSFIMNVVPAQDSTSVVVNPITDPYGNTNGSAYTFKDSTGLITASTISGDNFNYYQLDGEFTLECYFKFDQLPTTGNVVILNYGLSTPGFRYGTEIDFDSGGAAKFVSFDGAVYSEDVISTINDLGWHHYAVFRDSSNAMRHTLDGSLLLANSTVGNSTSTTNTDTFILNSTRLFIGDVNNQTGNSAIFTLKDLHLSNTNRYSNSYTAPTAAASSDDNTILLLDFDEPDGSVSTQDRSFNYTIRPDVGVEDSYIYTVTIQVEEANNTILLSTTSSSTLIVNTYGTSDQGFGVPSTDVLTLKGTREAINDHLNTLVFEFNYDGFRLLSPAPRYLTYRLYDPSGFLLETVTQQYIEDIEL